MSAVGHIKFSAQREVRSNSNSTYFLLLNPFGMYHYLKKKCSVLVSLIVLPLQVLMNLKFVSFKSLRKFGNFAPNSNFQCHQKVF